MILLQTDLQEKLIDVSPYNTLAYGVLVSIMALAVIFLFRMYQAEKKYNRERDNKMLELMPMILDRLKSQTGMPGDITKIAEDTKAVLVEAKSHYEALNDRIRDLSDKINK